MENISEKIGKCCLYDDTPPQYTVPKYICAFGQLALVHPPPPPKPQPTPPSAESHKPTRGRPPKGKKGGVVCIIKYVINTDMPGLYLPSLTRMALRQIVFRSCCARCDQMVLALV